MTTSKSNLTSAGTGRKTSAARVGTSKRISDLLLRNAMIVVLVVVVVMAQITYEKFLTWNNLQLILSQNAQLGIIAVGTTFVIMSGSFDLSIVPVYVLSAGVFAQTAPSSGWFAALLIAIVVGAAAGVVNSFVVTGLKVNSFIATLGTAAIFGGLVQVYVGTTGVQLNDPQAQYLGQSSILGLPVSVVVLAIILVLGQLLLSITTFGRSIQAVGGNLEASRLAGLATTRVRTLAFVISGVAAAIAGVVFASRIGFIQSAQVQSESGLLLNAIAVVVVGGTSLMGGEGAVWRTAIGVAIFACLSNIFTALAIDPTTANLVKGTVLIAAVAIDTFSRNRRAGS